MTGVTVRACGRPPRTTQPREPRPRAAASRQKADGRKRARERAHSTGRCMLQPCTCESFAVAPSHRRGANIDARRQEWKGERGSTPVRCTCPRSSERCGA